MTTLLYNYNDAFLIGCLFSIVVLVISVLYNIYSINKANDGIDKLLENRYNSIYELDNKLESLKNQLDVLRSEYIYVPYTNVILLFISDIDNLRYDINAARAEDIKTLSTYKNKKEANITLNNKIYEFRISHKRLVKEISDFINSVTFRMEANT